MISKEICSEIGSCHRLSRTVEMKNDLHKYETDKKWADGMIKSEKAHIEQMLKTQREKCN
ncbi:hypothetical protein [Terasakiella pusilla]|uniref:hypothetical protein n=1 Tax=Terasakiella pusilla TaxID=64973 RepID=UPI003AA90F75